MLPAAPAPAPPRKKAAAAVAPEETALDGASNSESDSESDSGSDGGSAGDGPDGPEEQRPMAAEAGGARERWSGGREREGGP